MERFYTFVFVAGIGCFAIAFVLSMVFPWMSLKSYHGMDYLTLEDLAQVPSAEFVELSDLDDMQVLLLCRSQFAVSKAETRHRVFWSEGNENSCGIEADR